MVEFTTVAVLTSDPIFVTGGIADWDWKYEIGPLKEGSYMLNVSYLFGKIKGIDG
ncbi:hypothetical protein [Xanthovirga aplysinae]|uniref:hypothetical protein n=1 Tax=Xanthovirga aplysinae TaxID=2529853 RepID=UPI001CA3A9C5|nr:hypothetical protein [Xanthovirga aplysinae]